MAGKPLAAVTGAFGYTGRYITRRLLERGEEVITLTSKPASLSPFGEQVRAYPFNFEAPQALAASLEGVSTLYNTYWVRFNHGAVTYDRAVENTRTLLRAAREAGVRRVVQVSIANPDLDSPLPYYRGKALVEQAVRESGLSYAILRPAVVFGREDILINNIAYLLRRFPFFAIPGRGDYRLQPVFVEDLAELAVEAGAGSEDVVLEAVGPEVFRFDELVRLIAAAVGSRARLVHLPPALALALSRAAGLLTRDVILTREELVGLMDEVLVSPGRPMGRTCFSEWLRENGDVLGRSYASELDRHYRE
jgi:uncharacterized protein YbjT (DUF2867 family)